MAAIISLVSPQSSLPAPLNKSHHGFLIFAIGIATFSTHWFAAGFTAFIAPKTPNAQSPYLAKPCKKAHHVLTGVSAAPPSTSNRGEASRAATQRGVPSAMSHEGKAFGNDFMQCMVTTPVDAFEVKMDSWLMPATDKQLFLERLSLEHNEMRSALDNRKLRGYEKGIYLLFSTKCFPMQFDDVEEVFCAECHQEDQQSAPDIFGRSKSSKPLRMSGISARECFQGPHVHKPRCLLGVQKMKSWKLFSVQPPRWSNSGGMRPFQ